MKVALCISGQPRKAFETYPFIYENIIKPNNADVFIHMHYDENNLYCEKSHLNNGTCYFEPETDKKIIDLYKPIKYLIESPRNFQNPNINIPLKRIHNHMRMCNMDDENMCKKHMLKQMISMYYSIYKCNELKEIYANENNFVYDYVIRLRFDFVPFQPIICSHLSRDYIYYLELGQPDELISDWINIGSNLTMNVYSSLFLNIEYLNTFQYYKKNERHINTCEPSDVCSGLNEFLLRDLMNLYKIPKMAFSINNKLLY
jgi:hypothetical protein